jgi:stage V sporulation protein B
LVAAARGEGKDAKASRILSAAILYALVFSSLATLVLFLGAGFIARNILVDQRAASALRILAPSLIPLALISVFSGYFVGIKRVGCNAVTQISGQLFKVGITVLLVLKSAPMEVEKAAVTLSLGSTLSEILCFLIILLEFFIDRRNREKEKGAAISEVCGMAIPLALSAYIRQALLTLEHILIPKRLRKHGASQSAALSSYGVLHGMALPMILYPMVTLSSFSGLLVPEFAERSASKDSDGMRRLAVSAFSATIVYAILSSTVLFIFSEELGYVVYGSSFAGSCIAILAPVVPIMYLDHVTDSVLKGIGEHVYSMWINITDAMLSIALVWFLLPKLGIMGYAVCIIIMEAYNFALSSARLLSRIRFSISLKRSVIFPLISSLFSSYLIKRLFVSAGSSASALWLFMKLLFAVSAFVFLYRICLLLDSAVLNRGIKKH